jgi:hypothetical protein
LRGTHGGTTAELSAIYAAVKDIQDPFRRRAFRASIIAEWAVRDPRAALAYLQEKDKGNAGQLIREWLRLDPQAAISHLLTDEKMRGELRGVLSEIARVAPARLAEAVSVLPKSDSRWDTTAQDAFAIFAAKDPDTARAAAESITGVLRGQALAGVAKTWAENDGAAALAWAQGLPEGEARDAALKGALIGWAKYDPAAALNKLDLVPPGAEEMYYASDVGAQVLSAAAKRDWDGTVAWLRDHPGSSADRVWTDFRTRFRSDSMPIRRARCACSNKAACPALTQVLANAFLNDGYAQHDTIWAWLDQQPAREFTMGVRSSLINCHRVEGTGRGTRISGKSSRYSGETGQILESGTRSLINGGSQMHRFEELFEKASPTIRTYIDRDRLHVCAEAMVGAIRSAGSRDSIRLRLRSATLRLAGWRVALRRTIRNVPSSGLCHSGSHADAMGLSAPVASTWAMNDVLRGRDLDRFASRGRRIATMPQRGLVSAISFSEPESAGHGR